MFQLSRHDDRVLTVVELIEIKRQEAADTLHLYVISSFSSFLISRDLRRCHFYAAEIIKYLLRVDDWKIDFRMWRRNVDTDLLMFQEPKS